MLIQSDYLQKTQQASALEIKAQELSQIQNKLDDIKANFKIPFDDQMADYLIEILDTQDEIEYYEKAIAEAERILEEKPELCTW